MKKILLAVLSIALLVGVVAFAPEMASAAPKDEICQGVGAVSAGGCDPGENTLDKIVQFIVNIFSAIIGIVAVIMLMVAGYKYTSSGGDSSKVSSAKSTILYAIIGLVVVALAQTIVWFVLQRSTETEEERKKREAEAAKTTYLAPTPRYYTVEFNNKVVL